MNIITFLIVGLIAGWIASALVKGHGSGLISDMVIGIIGAFVGGFVFSLFDVTAYGFYGSLVMSTVGATVLLLISGFFYRRNHPGKLNV